MKFSQSLIEGKIISRRGQFIMSVDINGVEQRCHCPTTGRIGTFDITGRPCLLSGSENPNRSTRYTVEAISLNRLEDENKSWIGINQNTVNRYVEYCLNCGEFRHMISVREKVLREQMLGFSKLDFLVDNTYLEVKTPLQDIQLPIPEYVKIRKTSPLTYTDRLKKHITDLANSLQTNQRAIMLIVFMYDNPGFKVISRSTNSQEVYNTVNSSVSKGVEIWQANFKITPEEVVLSKYFPLTLSEIIGND